MDTSSHSKSSYKEHTVLESLLRDVTPLKTYPNHPTNGSTAAKDGSERLSFDGIEATIVDRVTRIGERATALVLNYFAVCYRRCIDTASNPSVPEELKQKVLGLQTELIAYAGLLFTCPEIYNLNITVEERSELLLNYLREGKDTKFILKLVDDSTKDSSENLLSFIPYIIKSISEESANQKLTQYDDAPLNLLKALATNKHIARAIAHDESFLLSDLSSIKLATHSLKGFTLERKSLLGHILCHTPIDAGGRWKARERFATVVFSMDRYTHKTFEKIVTTYRNHMNKIGEVTHEILKHLCLADKESCDYVLTWFAMILNSNQRRAKLGHVSLTQEGPESCSPYYELMLSTFNETSFGFSLNVFWSLLLLTEPIRLELQRQLDPFFVMRTDKVSEIVLGNFATEAKLGDEEAMQRATQFLTDAKLLDTPSKFTTQVFWLTLRGLSVLFKPAMEEFSKIIASLEQLQRGQKSQSETEEYNKRIGELQTWYLVLLNPRFVTPLVNFLHMALTFLLRTMYCYEPSGAHSERVAKSLDGYKGRIVPIVHQACAARVSNFNDINRVIPPQFAVLPSRLIDDIFDSIKLILALHDYWEIDPFKLTMDPATALDCDVVTSVCYSIMMSPDYFRSINTRCYGAQLFSRFFGDTTFRDYFENSQVARQVLIPSLSYTYIDSQKADYYNRLLFRIPIVDTFLKALASDVYIAQFHKLSRNHTETFVRLVHFLLSDVSVLVEDAMSCLSEIRRREIKGDTSQSPSNAADAPDGPISSTNASSSSAEDPQQSENDDELAAILGVLQGDGSRRLDFPTLQKRTRNIVDFGFKTCLLLWTFAKYYGEAIVNASVLVPNTVTCLDCCLDHLVGPKCLKLKVRNFSEYKFNPKEWLSKVCETYIFLVNADQSGDTIIREIVQDGRFYSPGTFKKAYAVLRREGLMSSSTLTQFGNIITKLLETKDEDNDYIPDEYLDPVMQEIMTDPVKLPTSNVIMDRKHIERHLMSDPTDPFNRMPLSKEELNPIPELKREIEEYLLNLKSKRREAELL